MLTRYPERPAEFQFDSYRRRVRDLDAAVRLSAGGEFALVLPAAGRGSRLGSDVPKSLFPVTGKPALLYSLEAFGPWSRRIAIVVSPTSQEGVIELCSGRPESIEIVLQAEPTGDWHAVSLAVDQLHLRRGHVIVAWSDLVITSAEVIRQTIESHLDSGADLTFPTMFERDPYLAVLRDDDGRVIDVAFRNERSCTACYLEHDCSFFVFGAEALRAGLAALAQRPSTGEVRFVHIIPCLAVEGRDVQAIPLGVNGSFQGFNTREEEAALIAAHINRV